MSKYGLQAREKSIGRKYGENVDVYSENPFKTDQTKILDSKSSRRLTDTAQVISLSLNSHTRNRATHTLEVVSKSINISERLGLNTDLCMAIAYAHDIGHTPYGHIGETTLSRLSGKDIRHNVLGAGVIPQYIERCGHGIDDYPGLNLSHETLEGVLNHSKGRSDIQPSKDSIQEHLVVMYADKIAYLFADLNDAIRYNLLNEEPKVASRLGPSQRRRVYKVIDTLFEESREKGFVSFTEDSGEIFEQYTELKDFMYTEVYDKCSWDIQITILEQLYKFFSGKECFENVDYDDFSLLDPILSVALLTDKEADEFGRLLRKSKKPTIEDVKGFSIFEILNNIKRDGRNYSNLDYTIPHLDWENDAKPDDFKIA